METLMIKAIREFKKHHKSCEIRSICAYEGTGGFKDWQDCTFHIEYIDSRMGDYMTTDINVEK